MSRGEIEAEFPRLKRTPYGLTSPPTPEYNCIAWAAGDSERWWWPANSPFAYWPPAAPRKVELSAFIAAYTTLGYEVCDDGSLEKGFEKIALYADSDGVPTHAARQLSNGTWTSKLGKLEDISHTTYGLTGSQYGEVARYMKRPIHISRTHVK